ncbi:MAG TPA: PPK2 family polyphosphate kinase [Chitinophagaceae bacterium]|nr:PPK2 family polyphosphate kinase [Chitinophagaceae bacterium]
MISLRDYSTIAPDESNKKDCKQELKEIRKDLFELQNKFYADGRFGLLVVLQGVDTAGKDGTTRHALSSMNPMGVRVTSFKKPLGMELEHDFLWRIYPHFPAKGMIGVFNRSYYEDILVPYVNKTLDVQDLQHRCHLINEMEDHLVRNNIHILKFILHLSREEQKQRIEERKTKAHKKWKYDVADDKAPGEWDKYIEAYDLLREECNHFPWHVVPADKRWFRNYKVAETVRNHLKSLPLKYPEK